LRLLSQNERVDEIVLVTVESTTDEMYRPEIPKTKHITLQGSKRPGLLKKLIDPFRFMVRLKVISSEENVRLVIGRGSMAGALGLYVAGSLKLPLVVESFEPHSDYMYFGGVWSRFDPRYLLQRLSERLIRRRADWLLPVSKRYEEKLIQDGVKASRIVTVPCSVDSTIFRIDGVARERIRAHYQIDPDVTVGVYLGQFGDIYYGEEAFEIFRETKVFFRDRFFLMVLTPSDHEWVQMNLEQRGFDSTSFLVLRADRNEVASFLNAADFGYTLVKETPTSEYCCPVKDGEYWATGLPVLITPRIGEDSKIISLHAAGAVLGVDGDTSKCLEKIQDIIARHDHREQLAKLASEFRSDRQQRMAYARLLEETARYTS
jgi:hypothetical protein